MIDQRTSLIFNQINKANDELKISQEKLESYENEFAQIDTITQQKKFQLEEIKKLEQIKMNEIILYFRCVYYFKLF